MVQGQISTPPGQWLLASLQLLHLIQFILILVNVWATILLLIFLYGGYVLIDLNLNAKVFL